MLKFLFNYTKLHLFEHITFVNYIFNYQETESLLRQEANIRDEDVKVESAEPSESEVSHALAAYKRLLHVSKTFKYFIFLLSF